MGLIVRVLDQMASQLFDPFWLDVSDRSNIPLSGLNPLGGDNPFGFALLDTRPRPQ